MKTSVLLFLTDIMPEKRRLYDKVVKNKIFDNSTATKVFQEFKKNGINGIEILIPQSVKPKDIDDLKKVVDENKIKIYSVHQPLRFLTKTKPTEIKKLFEIAKLYSSKIIVLHMSSVGKQLFNTKYIEELHLLEKEYGIKIGFENQEKHVGSVLNSYCWHSEKFAQLIAKHDFNITLDICHLGQTKGDIVEFFKKNKDRIVNIHLSDYRAHLLNNSLRPIRFKHMPLGAGQLPIKELIQVLKKENYKGMLTLEVETNLEGLLDSIRYINATS